MRRNLSKLDFDVCFRTRPISSARMPPGTGGGAAGGGLRRTAPVLRSRGTARQMAGVKQ